jgi:hypothetical protein
MVTGAQGRFIPFEACFNFRDLGGYLGLHNRLVRRERLYRSMTPQYMTEADLARAATLKIGLVIDLRGDRFGSSGALGEAPGLRVAVGPSFRRGNLQELPPEVAAFMAAPPEDALPRVLQTYGPSFARALSLIGEAPQTATLFHCRLGKDRTGVLAALLLKLLRVADADVIEDYMLTGYFEPEMKHLLARFETVEEAREPRVAREPVSRRAIECVLERLESQYGTAYNYFLRFGVPATTLNALIDGLLEPRGEPEVARNKPSWPQLRPIHSN